MTVISASVICMDHCNLAEDIYTMELADVEYLHLDPMDAHYVPRYGIYPEIAQRISEITKIPMDVHLMVHNPEFAIDLYGEVPTVETINFHIDHYEKDAFRIIERIKKHGKKAGIALNMSSSFDIFESLMEFNMLDSVLFMGIHPGVLKQTSRPDMARYNVEKFYAKYPDMFEKIIMQVDGGITFDSIPKFVHAGVTSIVCGTATVFKDTLPKDNPNKKQRREKIIANVKRVRECINGI